MSKDSDTKKEEWDFIYLNMSVEELVQEYLASRGHSPITLELIKSEIWRRSADRISRHIYRLTIVITVLTAFNVFFVVYSILR